MTKLLKLKTLYQLFILKPMVKTHCLYYIVPCAAASSYVPCDALQGGVLCSVLYAAAVQRLTIPLACRYPYTAQASASPSGRLVPVPAALSVGSHHPACRLV